MQFRTVFITLFFLSKAVIANPSIQNNNSTDNQPIFGLIEKVILQPDNLLMNAKMDTGALTSSLDARNIKKFSKNGRDWVRFDAGREHTLFINQPKNN